MRLLGDTAWRRALFGAWAVVAVLLLLEAVAGLPAVWHDRLPSWGFQAQHSLGMARLDGASLAVPVHQPEAREAARLQAGDRVLFPRAAERWLVPKPGDTREVQRLRRDGIDTITLTAVERPFTASERFDYLCRLAQGLPALVFSLMLALHRPLPQAHRHLSLAFLGYAMAPFLNFSFATAIAPLLVKQASFLAVVFGTYQVMRFCVEQLKAVPGAKPLLDPILWPLRLLCVAACASLLAYLNGLPQPWLGPLLAGMFIALQGVSAVALFQAHGRSVGRARVRQRFLLGAFALGVLPVTALMVGGGPNASGFEPGELEWPLVVLFVSYLLSYLGLGYGVLRHRVFDLYLAFDQAIVYAIALVPITGVVFALKHVAGLPFLDWYRSLGDGNEARFIQGAIVVAAYLAGHFTFHWLDHRVQHLVFHRRHRRAEALRQFLREAQHIVGQEALLRGLHEQLERFTERAGNAVYLRLSGGDFAQVFNSIPRAPHLLEGDDALLVKMRQQAQPRWLDSGDAPSQFATEAVGVLALPMLRRGQVGGLVVMGQRRNGESYRPDEVALMREVVEHVALDLQAIAAARWEHGPGAPA